MCQGAVLKPQTAAAAGGVCGGCIFYQAAVLGGEGKTCVGKQIKHSSCTGRIFPEYGTVDADGDGLQNCCQTDCTAVIGGPVCRYRRRGGYFKPISRIGAVEVNASAMICAVPGKQHASCKLQKRGCRPAAAIAGKKDAAAGGRSAVPGNSHIAYVQGNACARCEGMAADAAAVCRRIIRNDCVI